MLGAVIRFLLARLIGLVFVLFAVVTITFFLIKAIPGGPLDREKEPPPHIKQQQLEQWGLDGSVWSQYRRYIADLLRGDLRESYRYRNRDVREILGQSLPVSITLGGIAFVIATTGGIFLGTFAAVRRNQAGDYAAMFAALLAISIPTFVSGPLLILVFALWAGWFPPGGWFGLAHVALPAFCLALPYVAYIARLMRNSLVEVIGQDFVRTARAKGLTERAVVWKHALKVAILPVVTFLGPLAAHLLTGSIVVEQIFTIPGAGQFFVTSIQNRDSYLLAGVVIVYCTLLIGFNFAVDLAYSFLDKRIRLYG